MWICECRKIYFHVYPNEYGIYVPAIAARYNFFIFTAQPLPRANKWSEMSLEQIAVDEIPDETV